MFSKRVCHVRSLDIGGDNPVRVQTMYDSSLIGADIDALIKRIGKLSAMGCDLIRFSYSSLDDAPYFSQVAKRSVMPVVADIHFDYRLALSALENGADKIRINPGNLLRSPLLLHVMVRMLSACSMRRREAERISTLVRFVLRLKQGIISM